MKNKVIIMNNKSNKIDFDKLEVHIFDKKLMNNIKFDSGDYDLNEFLYKESIEYCKSNLAVVYLIFNENKLIGYFSLSSDSIKVIEKLDINLKYYPSMKIGRLAVDKKYQNSGIGTWIIDWIIGFTINIRWSHGIRYLSVDAYNNPQTLNFYSKNEFLIYGKVKENMRNIPMYLDINKINDDELI